MKHGIAFRKLSRTSSHRMLMLRNLVSSLLEHEQIKTTLPKAKEAARLAEKIITLGKRGTLPAQREAASFLLNSHTTLPSLFGSYADRYRERPGGYTRIHKFGHRKGDHAPHAILELCDNPRDIKFEMVARSVGRETAQKWLRARDSSKAVAMEHPAPIGERPWIRDATKTNYEQLMKFASEDRKALFEDKAIDWANRLLAEPQLDGGLRRPAETKTKPKNASITVHHVGRRLRAGERLAGTSDSVSSLGLAAGAIGKPKRGLRDSESSLGRLGAPPSLLSPGGLRARDGQTLWRSRFWEGGWKDLRSTATTTAS